MRLVLNYWKPVTMFCRNMSSSGERIIAVCQMTSKNDKKANLRTCMELVKDASEKGAKVVFLPEACDYVGESKAETLQLSERLDGELVKEYRSLARKYNVWLSLGGIHEKVDAERVRNSHVIINNDGEIISVYNKTHLFDVEIPDKNIRLKESDYVLPGNNIVPPVPSPVGNIGLAICYDMRFPELSTILRSMGAEILTYPSAFTQRTGAAHWEILLRARAIENQCYVVAAAQCGAHNSKRASWGHAMIIDPWGTIVSQCSEGVSTAVAEINHSLLKKVRKSMPVMEHRRYDLYPEPSHTQKTIAEPKEGGYRFGNSVVKLKQIFYETESIMAFTNKKCVLPGHVLVATKRSAKRMVDLTEKEISELFLVVVSVQKAVQIKYKASSSTISLQDGVHAGQTVEHVHVHIIPRKPGDFVKNDDIYEALEEHDKGGKNNENGRSDSEMFQEAEELQKYFF